MLEKVFETYKDIYLKIVDSFYPSLGSTGFQERNLTVNFSKAYEKTFENEMVFSWFELQFGENKDNHFDCVIVNQSKKEIYFVESKRFTNTTSKTASIRHDVKRIQDYVDKDFSIDERFDKFKEFKVYGLILADIWLENNKKIAVYDRFINKTFFNDVTELLNKSCDYKVIDFKIKRCEAKYALLSFLWTAE